ncbi:MAG: HEAT repeat domain-containing protein [Myxococcales bacterium]|nr:HEAT repeat domain-containing protein [Myxococcota bacterium]MDW8281603.1 HEAT repeat domain-containing protein [Myxococcales bacterium]
MMTSHSLSAALLLAVGLALPVSAAPPEVPAELRAAVEALLMGYEPADPGPALRRLGPQAADALVQLAQDPSVPPLRRLRAIEALGYVPTPSGLQFLRQLVAQRRDARDPVGIYELAAAARALGGHGASQVSELIPLLDHDSADVREGAAAALGAVRTLPLDARRALERRLQRERDGGVRATLARALRPK